MSLKSRQLAIIISAAIALLFLVYLQFRWISYARTLVEQEFDAKVNMALRSSTSIINEQLSSGMYIDFVDPYDQSQCGKSIVETSLDAEELRKILDQTFLDFDILLDYSFAVESLEEGFPFLFKDSSYPYSCKVGSGTELLRVRFFGKKDYVRSQLAWMTTFTLFFIVLAVVLFLLTVRQWLWQKRLNQWNIDFFNNMAHEFRTPLTNMRLALGLWKRKSDMAEDNPYLQILQEENAHLFSQVERVLDISKLEKDQLLLQKQPFSITQLCGHIIDQMQVSVEEKKGTIAVDFPKEDLLVNGDQLHISNAIRNIVDNAIKYSKEAPVIKMSIQPENNFICLTISDNGVGIPKKHQKANFQRFFRVKEGNPTAIKGFGLGLTYVKKVVEQHAGFLTLKSMPKSGSTFQLFFPQHSVY